MDDNAPTRPVRFSRVATPAWNVGLTELLPEEEELTARLRPLMPFFPKYPPGPSA